MTHGDVRDADADADALSIVQHWGFEIQHHHVQFELTLDAPPASSWTPPDGITLDYIASLEPDSDPELDDVLQRADTSPEAAESGPTRLRDLAEPGTFAVVARQERRAVGCCIVREATTHAWMLLTATVPEARGRGIARVVKQAAHHHGYARGIRVFTTQNDATNQAVQRLNRQFGYQQVDGTYHLIRRAPAT